MSHALANFYSEHSSIAAVLGALSSLVREVRDRGKRIDPKVFRAILYYLDVFPEREHHRKEEEVFFARIRQRTHEADAVLDRLALEHTGGERAIRDLEQRFVRYEEHGASEFPAFAAVAEAYVLRYLEHMRTEEQQVIPIAIRALNPDDWKEIQTAFAAHRDPLKGAEAETDAEKLFRRIVLLVPSPYGVGAEIEPE
jgi:hemerythrin-like domain-containing protein